MPVTHLMLLRRIGDAAMSLPNWAVVAYGIIGIICAGIAIWLIWSYIDSYLKGQHNA